MPQPIRIASVNVNGIRAAFRKGMGQWLADRDIDILALQEVRAETADVVGLLGDGWHVLHDAAAAKGRAGVAIASRIPAAAHRMRLKPDAADSSGRWLEADFAIGDGKAKQTLTVVSTYVHSGEVGTPRQDAKYAFLSAMTERMRDLGSWCPLALIVGDLNVGHRELDIKNWRANRKNAGFLPEERSYFDRFFGPLDEPITGTDESMAPGLGWVDVGRRWAGEVEGPYTWWSQRGKAFDNDTGWRIDYHVATPQLASAVIDYRIDRAAAYDERWSDHAPVVVDYQL